MSPVHDLPFCSTKTYFYIIFTTKPRSANDLFPSGFHTKFCMHFSCRTYLPTPRPSHPLWFDNSDILWQGTRVMKFSPPSSRFLLQGQSIFHRTLFNNKFSLCPALNIKYLTKQRIFQRKCGEDMSHFTIRTLHCVVRFSRKLVKYERMYILMLMFPSFFGDCKRFSYRL